MFKGNGHYAHKPGAIQYPRTRRYNEAKGRVAQDPAERQSAYERSRPTRHSGECAIVPLEYDYSKEVFQARGDWLAQFAVGIHEATQTRDVASREYPHMHPPVPKPQSPQRYGWQGRAFDVRVEAVVDRMGTDVQLRTRHAFRKRHASSYEDPYQRPDSEARRRSSRNSKYGGSAGRRK